MVPRTSIPTDALSEVSLPRSDGVRLLLLDFLMTCEYRFGDLSSVVGLVGCGINTLSIRANEFSDLRFEQSFRVLPTA